MIAISPLSPTFIICDAFPVELDSREGSATQSTLLMISSEIALYFAGALLPDRLAEVETIALPKRDISALQKALSGMRIPTLPSSETTFGASALPAGEESVAMTAPG